MSTAETITSDDVAGAHEEDLVELDQVSQEFIDKLTARIIVFIEDDLVGYPFFDYQRRFAARLIESVLIGDGETVTALFARQSGKSETVANVVAGLMILLPRLAKMFPEAGGGLKKFERGFWVGCFAPTEEQADTLYSRIVSRLTSDRAIDIMLDPEIDDKPSTVGGKGKAITLKKSGSLVRMQTANPKANIEGKTYHLILIDEAQDADEKTVNKSILPMGAFTNASVVMTGTPTTHKGVFYKSIQLNKRRQTRRGQRQNHFEANWREPAKNNPDYAAHIKRQMLKIGEDSDEFQMSYNLKWLLERGMFTTSNVMDELGDTSMQVVKAYFKSPIIVGIDPARVTDSTVVTAVFVDWDRPDPVTGLYDHRVLNWLEMHGDDWEEQYFRIIDFCSNYDVLAVAVDGQGVGDAVAQRLARLMPRTEVRALPSTLPEQSKRWKHLMQLLQRGLVSWPAHANTRRLRTYKRFYQQMVDLEKNYKGPHLIAAAPEEAEAHDDYPDSLALACVLTSDLSMPEVEVSESPFVGHRR